MRRSRDLQPFWTRIWRIASAPLKWKSRRCWVTAMAQESRHGSVSARANLCVCSPGHMSCRSSVERVHPTLRCCSIGSCVAKANQRVTLTLTLPLVIPSDGAEEAAQGVADGLLRRVIAHAVCRQPRRWGAAGLGLCSCLSADGAQRWHAALARCVGPLCDNATHSACRSWSCSLLDMTRPRWVRMSALSC